MSLLEHTNYYLIGIKGVAMTALAQMLRDAGKQVKGSDTAEKFVTQDILDKLHISIDTDFTATIPENTDCVIYTSAHQSQSNPQVVQALERNIPIVTQAEAIADLFNQKQGIAVCGVGGKSTVSAMIAWILEKLEYEPSYFVGVGNIPGMNKTGHWEEDSPYCVAEADEYVTDPMAPQKGEEITPKFSFLYPYVSVCTNLEFDHPDVYRDFDHTKQVFGSFLAQTAKDGAIIVNHKDLPQLRENITSINSNTPILSFGETDQDTIQLVSFAAEKGQTKTKFRLNNTNYELILHIPGKFNALNGLAAILATTQLGIDPQESAAMLSQFRSTMRRFEYIGEKHGVTYYDDYAHHPHEVAAVIRALQEWYPQQRKVIAFQSHTYSRTKQLFSEFVNAFAEADEVVMIDIFSSAREADDPTISSTKLCQAIQEQFGIPAQNLGTVSELVKFCRSELKPGDVLMTVGAGNIYEIHQQLT